MSTSTATVESAPEPGHRSSNALFVGGIVARTWLWFVGGCLLITLVPILFGWRPFVVQSGSMEPRINVGDIVLAAPVGNAEDVLGRVTVFVDPDKRENYKTHRVVALNGDGTMTTQGDANPTPDGTHITMADVRGLGRLLVSFAGLPFVWARGGQWLLLLLFLASLVGAAVITSRDRDDDEQDDDPTDGEVVPLTTRSDGAAIAIAASAPLDPGLRFAGLRLPAVLRRPLVKLAYVTVLALALVVPTTGASFAASTGNTANSWSAANPSYSTTVTGMSPWLYWKLDETTGTTAADTSGNGRTGTYNPNAAAFTRGIVGALATDTPNLGVTLNGTTSCINTTSTTTMNAPAQITEVVWFKTTTTNGGKLLGFEMPQTGVAMPGSGGTYDRHIYMDGAGKVWFGVYNGGYFTISSPTALNNGAWHMAAATMGTGGMALWIDGVQVGTNANAAGETTTGWFRAGCGNLGGWGGSWTGANSPTTSTSPTQNRPFAGSLDEISVWQSVLTNAQIASLWGAH